MQLFIMKEGVYWIPTLILANGWTVHGNRASTKTMAREKARELYKRYVGKEYDGRVQECQ